MKPLYDDQLIVVTGGAGFIGSAAIRHLNNQGFTNIIVVDELGQDERWKNLVNKKFIEVVSPKEIWEWLKDKEELIEAFLHLGACSDTLETNASYLLENNTRFSIRLAEYALKNEHRFIYASSAATYGDGTLGFSDSINDIYKLQPLNMYGFSKQLFDQWAVSQGVADRMVGLKYFNVFGPNEYHKGRMASAICKMTPHVLKGEKISLFKSSDPQQFADGEQKRDFIYIKPAVEMTCAFLSNDSTGLYNIGSGEAISWNRLAKAIGSALGKEAQIQYIDMPTDLIGKYQNYSCADMSKTVNVLGEKATCMTFEAAVKDYVVNYLVPGKRW